MMLKNSLAYGEKYRHLEIVLGIIGPPTADSKIGRPCSVAHMVKCWKQCETMLVVTPLFL